MLELRRIKQMKEFAINFKFITPENLFQHVRIEQLNNHSSPILILTYIQSNNHAGSSRDNDLKAPAVQNIMFTNETSSNG